MKKLCYVLILALLLSLGASAFADNGVEIIYMDGIPVVMESFGLSLSDSDAFDAGAGFTLPEALADIGEEAFAGIAASRVEITENVKTIGKRAFADCKNLREIVIPATVEHIDDSALDGCTGVTIFGEFNSEAERFAIDNGFMFGGWDETIAPFPTTNSDPVVMPYVAF